MARLIKGKSDLPVFTMGKNDDLATPKHVFNNICNIVSVLGLPKIDLDLFASKKEHRCNRYLDADYNSFLYDHLHKDGSIPKTNFVQPPHKYYKQAVIQSWNQYHIFHSNYVFLIPSTNERTLYWQYLIEPYRIEINQNDGFVFYMPYNGTIKFERNGRPLLNKHGREEHAHNGYKLLFFISPKYISLVKQNIPKLYDIMYHKHNNLHQSKKIKLTKTNMKSIAVIK